MKSIVVTAYTVDPFEGSEAGMGWNFANCISQYQDSKITLITRKNNRPSIDKFLKNNPESISNKINFQYYDLHPFVLYLKKKLGVVGSEFYYFLWNLFVAYNLRIAKVKYDLYHCLNFHTDWIPHFLYIAARKKPVVWGPIGHHEPVPSWYLDKYKYPLKEKVGEFLKLLIKKCSWDFFPLVKIAISRSYALPMNIDTINRINMTSLEGRNWSQIKSVASDPPSLDSINLKSKTNSNFKILSVGRLVPLKGFCLTIHSFSCFYHSLSSEERKNVSLTIIGRGSYLHKYKALAKQLRVDASIDFIDWMPYDEVLKKMIEFDIFLFPSFEAGGMVVVEAMQRGAIPITLRNGGPGETVSFKQLCVEVTNSEKIIQDLAATLSHLFHSHSEASLIRNQVISHSHKFYSWQYRSKQLHNVYNDLLA